ncbi:MAG: EamA family transporter [Candidatus Sericytochromatia bacterium]|nr:EamA family transporter [Candidatus Sericytochromatia bacterium]
MASHRGIGQAHLAACLFGLTTPLAKGLVGQCSPHILAGLFYGGSGLGLTLWGILRRQKAASAEAALQRQDWPWLAGAILFGGIIGPVLLLTGLSLTSASSASLLLNLEGVFTALLAWVVFRENVDGRIALGMGLIVLGGAAFAWDSQLTWAGLAGPLAIAAACLCWAVDNNLTQKVSAADPVQIAAIKGLVAGLVNLGLGFWLGAALPAPAPVIAAMALGFVGYGLSLVLFILALRSLGTARTGAYFSLAPFIGAGASLLLWREPVTPAFLGAAALMTAGIWLHVTERHGHLHTHDSLAHAHRHSHDEHHQHDHTGDDPPGEPHTHPHVHQHLVHRHPHFPDVHHRHEHGD